MGSGVTRRFWSSKGSRTSRRSMTKSRKGREARLRMKAWRAEAKKLAALAEGRDVNPS